MSRKAPPELTYTDEEIVSLLSSCKSIRDSWIITTSVHQLNELTSLEKQLRESLPKEREKAIFLMPLRLPDDHVVGMIFKKTADKKINLFYFNPISDSILSTPEAEILQLLVKNVFPTKEVELIDVRFKIGNLGAEDSAAVLVQSLIDVARVLEKEELVNRSEFVSKAKIPRFHYDPDRSKINTTKEKHYEQEKGGMERGRKARGRF